MTGILEVAVEAGPKVGQDMVLLPIFIDLLLYTLHWLSVRTANLVEQNVRNLSVFASQNVSLPLQDVDVAYSIVFSGAENGEHLLYELSVHENVKIKDI